ncbi:MAG TPA: hypothetical protein VFN67_07990 [Polyangiales bacterium]|jgi:hypothetical protein|nr:hypothetical protein [Polyangiales bacterium]
MDRGLHLLIRVGSAVAFGIWAMACGDQGSRDSTGGGFERTAELFNKAHGTSYATVRFT